MFKGSGTVASVTGMKHDGSCFKERRSEHFEENSPLT